MINKCRKWISFILVLFFTVGALLPAAPLSALAAEGTTPAVAVDKDTLYFREAGESQSIAAVGPAGEEWTITAAKAGTSFSGITFSGAGMTDEGKVKFGDDGQAELAITLADAAGLADGDQVTITIASTDAAVTDTAEIAAVYATTIAKEISFDQTKMTLSKNESLDLAAVLDWQGETEGAAVTHKAATWSSSDDKIVQADAHGVITALALGTATITVTASEPLTPEAIPASASITVTVGAIIVDSIAVDVDTVSVADDSVQTVNTTLRPAAAKPIKVVIDHPEYVNLQQVDLTDADAPWIDIAGDNMQVQYDTNGQAVLKIGLKPENISAEWKDGDVIATITIGGEGCDPATVSVRYRGESKYLSSILLDKKKVVLKAGETYLVKPVLKPTDATDFGVTWTAATITGIDADGNEILVEDESVVKVKDGLITATAPGKVRVTVKAAKPVPAAGAADKRPTASLVVEVYADIPSVDDDVLTITTLEGEDAVLTNSEGERTLTVQGQGSYRLVLKDAGTNEEMVWSSEKKSIAAVNQKDPANPDMHLANGECILTTLAPGKTEIAVKGQSSGQKLTINLVVAAVPAAAIVITNGDLTAAKGREIPLEVTVTPLNATGVKVKWSSSDKTVVSVSSKGIATVKKDSGTATITAEVVTKDADDRDVTRTDSITITASPVDAIRPGNDTDNTLSVWEVDENGHELVPAAAPIIRTTTNADHKIEFVNTTTPTAPVVLDLGEVRYYRVKMPKDVLTSAAQIKWITSQRGFVTASQKQLDEDEYLLTVKASTSATKAESGEIVRVIASNVGTYGLAPSAIVDSPYANYPEILITLYADGPESMTITKVPTVLEQGDDVTLGIKAKPSRCNDSVLWKIAEIYDSHDGARADAAAMEEIAEIDSITGLLTVKKVDTVFDTVVVRATAKFPAVKGDMATTATATAEVPIGYKISNVKLNATKITLGYDETFKLEVSAQPYNVLLDPRDITFTSRDPYVAEVDEDGVVTIYSPGTAQFKESTYIDVQVAGQKTMKCKVTVAPATAAPELGNVKITPKKENVTLIQGKKGVQLGYTISGLTTEQKKRVVVKWSYGSVIDDSVAPPVTHESERVVYVDPLGVVSPLNTPEFDTAIIKAEFYYGDDRTRIPDPTDPTKPYTLEYTVHITPILKVDVGGGAGYTTKPPLITDLNAIGAAKTMTTAIYPIGANTSITPQLNTTAKKYVTVTPDAADPNKWEIKVIDLPKKPTKISIILKDSANTKINVTIKIQLPAKS